MTTNHPEKLDAALIRPGRVDRKVEFKKAMKEQVRELFLRMYSGTETESSKPHMNGVNGAIANGSADSHIPEKAPNGKPVSNGSIDKKFDPNPGGNLEELAAEFAARIPDDTYTPAEIQNHLMRFKKEPWAAVERVGNWMDEMTAEKDKQNDLDEGDTEDLVNVA